MQVQEYKLLPGGAQAAITATPVAVDLSAFIGWKVLLVCIEQNLRVCGSVSASPATLIADATVTAASTTGNVAYQIAKGFAVPFEITDGAPFIIAATDTGSGTLKVKPVCRVERL